jgi:pyrimidine operon attenuation protein/uracil phosphoribosyltransferase
MSKIYVIEMEDKAAEKIASNRRRGAAAKRTGVPFSDAWKMGKEIAGYGEDSLIWGKTRAQVHEMLEDLYRGALKAAKDKDAAKFETTNKHIALIEDELEKRKAARAAADALRK